MGWVVAFYIYVMLLLYVFQGTLIMADERGGVKRSAAHDLIEFNARVTERNVFFSATTPAKVALAVKSTLLRLPAPASKPKTD